MGATAQRFSTTGNFRNLSKYGSNQDVGNSQYGFPSYKANLMKLKSLLHGYNLEQLFLKRVAI